MNGYVKIHRKLWTHPVFSNILEAGVFAYMISQASWKPRTVRYKDLILNLKRGQLAISQRDLAIKTGFSRGKVEKLLKRLKNEAMIEATSKPGVNIISICNYDSYQYENDERSQDGSHLRSQGEATPKPQNKKDERKKKEYLYIGKVIKLEKTDYQRWQKSFPSLNLDAELESLDSYYASLPPNESKGWFMRAAAALRNRQAKEVAQQPDRASWN